jgi:folate-dependent phosphoribosylglycinamide formyltransferase PurN
MGQPLRPPIRVAFLSSGGVFGDIVLRGLLSIPELQVVGVVQSRRVFKKGLGFLTGAFHFFRHCGVFYTVYIWGVTTFAEWMAFLTGRGGILARARKHCLPVLRTRDVNSPDGIAFLKNLGVDLLVSAHFDQKLEPPLCDGPEFAAVNIHPSTLPHHKGLEPVLRAWFDMENPPGVTLHRLSEKIDAGRMLASNEGKTFQAPSLYGGTSELMEAGVQLLTENTAQLLDRDSGIPQQGGGSYHSWPKAPEVHRFLTQGGRFIDFSTAIRMFMKDRE